MENQFINIKKIEFAIENATDEDKNKIFEQIHQLNVTVESVWIKTQLTKENEPKPSRSNESESYGDANETSDVKKESDVENSKIKLMEIGGGRNSKKNYYDENGYVYSKTNSSATTFYFRCRNKKFENCGARAICRGKDLDMCTLSRPHTHDPKRSSLNRVKFSKKLEAICDESPFKKSQEIYNEAKKALRKEINMDDIPERERFDSFIHRKLKKKIPLLAQSVEEFEQLINDPKYSHYMYDERKKLFYHGVWRGPTGANIVFLSETVLEEMRKLPRKKQSVKLLMDGTFKVVCYYDKNDKLFCHCYNNSKTAERVKHSLPMHIKFIQLYIINVIIEERSYPLAYILMTKRDTKSYELILGKLKAMFPNVNVECCMSDYEAATRKAIRIVFPTARLAGCYFHYVQAIVKAFKRFGLKTDEKFKGTMQQVSALALLPNEFITPGFNIISKSFKKSIRWSRFDDYWLRQWAPANISVYGLKDRTNNFAESLNKTINSILKAPHPHIWLLIENLRMVEMNRSDELVKVVAGHMVKPRKRDKEIDDEAIGKNEKESRSLKMKNLNEKILNATALFDKSQNVEKFLRNMTFDENIESYFKERICIGAENDSGIDVEDDGDYDETVIPNDSNIESNFQMKNPREVSKRKLKTKEINSKKLKQ